MHSIEMKLVAAFAIDSIKKLYCTVKAKLFLSVWFVWAIKTVA